MSNEPARLSIITLGQLRVRYKNRALAIAGRKARALLGYLAVSETHEATRERLVGLLWSEVEESNARASLRQTLRELRLAFEEAGIDGLKTDKLTVALDRELVQIDLFEVLEAAKVGRVHPRLLEIERALEHLLDEFDSIDPAFRIWLLAKRQALNDRILQHLEQALHAAAGRAEAARAILNLDPTHEAAARALIRLKADAGDIGGALGIYKALWDLLEEEYDVEPSKETQELIAAIRLAQPETGAAVRVSITELRHGAPEATEQLGAGKAVALSDLHGLSGTRPKLIVSVAAFDCGAIKQDVRYLVDGFRRELIACLVRFREWVVRDAALSTPGFQSTEAADYLIEASAIESRETVRLIITLRDLTSNTYLWSETLNVSIASWFEAQQRVVRRISTALNVHLSAERLVAVAHRPPGDSKAYDLWLLGQATHLSFDARNWERAKALFRKVIQQMPDFAPAYSSLAQLNNVNHIAMPGVFRDPRRTQEALDFSREAARLDPIDSRSQLCLGWSHAMAKQYEQAMIHIPLACELNENDPWTRVSSANFFAFYGEHVRAKEIADETLTLPLAPSPLQWAYLVAVRFMGSDYEGAVQAAVAAGDINPNVPAYKASALFHLGNRDAAAAEYRRFLHVVRSRWVGQEPASDANITRWFLTMFPIRRPKDWQRLRDGLAGAGAPVEGLAHNQW